MKAIEIVIGLLVLTLVAGGLYVAIRRAQSQQDKCLRFNSSHIPFCGNQ